MLAAIATLLAGIHTIGAALGALGATYAEIFYTKATADGHVDRREREWFATTYWSLSWGMVIVLLSGWMLIIVQYFVPNAPQAVLYAPLWMQNTLALVITFSAWLMSRRAASWPFVSAVIFAGWWMMLALDAWQAVAVSYSTLLIAYAALVFLSFVAWGYARSFAHAKAGIKS